MGSYSIDPEGNDHPGIGGLIWSQVAVAHDWNRWPSELGICDPDEDIPLMTAYTRQKQIMMAYDAQVAQKKHEQKMAEVKAKGKRKS